MKKRAFISVWDKVGAVEFAKGLKDCGYRILSTGGTQKALEDAGIEVINVSEVTGFPECLDGRVKTLHPKIHAGILAIRENPEHMKQLEELDITPIDLVAVNLYPFKETISKDSVSLEEAIENIDIGGPTMLRAAAKNWQDVTVICDPHDYDKVLSEIKENGEVSKDSKFDLAVKVFENTAAYDALIAQYLLKRTKREEMPEKYTMTFEKQLSMRYGENPHMKAAFYREPLSVRGSLADAEQLNGKELSFNNISDAAGALDILREFEETAVVAVKHTNPCGVACGIDVHEAYEKAYNCDPVSIFGGIVATNRKLEAKTAEAMTKIFLEIVIAPDYSDEALKILKQKKNLRVLRLKDINAPLPELGIDAKKVLGGMLIQDLNRSLFNEDELEFVTERKPTEGELKNLIFGFKVVKHVKSNAIVIAKDMATIGIGPGQVNRIWSTRMAIERSEGAVADAVMASDAFFPFDDCAEEAAKAGISAIIQPGGSVRDEDSIKKCNEYGIAMVFTKMRHFKH